jgi:hypothetical protein
MNPFTSDNFSAEVTPNIGPWTTHANKWVFLACLNSMFGLGLHQQVGIFGSFSNMFGLVGLRQQVNIFGRFSSVFCCGY